MVEKFQNFKGESWEKMQITKHLGSKVLVSGEIAAQSQKFAEGYARFRDVTDRDGALPAWVKALFMASAAAVKGHGQLLYNELKKIKRIGTLLERCERSRLNGIH